jgi:hypothetical protein
VVGGVEGQDAEMQMTVDRRRVAGPGKPAAVLIAGLDVAPRQKAETSVGAV